VGDLIQFEIQFRAFPIQFNRLTLFIARAGEGVGVWCCTFDGDQSIHLQEPFVNIPEDRIHEALKVILGTKMSY
jgi:hypothetical protein